MKTVIWLVKAGLLTQIRRRKDLVSNTANHLDSIMISGITLSKFLIKKGGKVNMYRYSCEVFTGNESK